jgi:hypothetical protein
MPMSGFPGSPRVFKGAIVGIDPLNPVASVIVFQYNPDAITRTLAVRAMAGGEEDQGTLRLSGPPEESIKLSIEVDATDQLEQGDPVAQASGVYPALTALEMLITPKSAVVIANEVLIRVGVIEVIPMEAPMTLLVWGAKRIVPVRITELSITEEAFDTDLNPIRAKVDLGVKVLTYTELGLLSPGGALYMTHQIAKEVMATVGGGGALAGGLAGALGIGR